MGDAWGYRTRIARITRIGSLGTRTGMLFCERGFYGLVFDIMTTEESYRFVVCGLGFVYSFES